MQNSSRLGLAGVLTAAGSCIALVATILTAFFTWMEYFVPYHYGVRIITESFYVATAIIIFELSAFVLGLLSASNTFNRRKFSSSILGATFLIIAGLLLFTNSLFNALPYVETLGANAGWIFSELYCGIPIIILASTSLTLIASRKTEFNNKETNPQTTLKTILILTATISAAFALFSIIPLKQSLGEFASNYPLATIIVSSCTFILATSAGALLLKKKSLHALIALTILSLTLALSLPFIFMSIFPWIGSFVKGIVTASPIIVLSVTALILEIHTVIKPRSTASTKRARQRREWAFLSDSGQNKKEQEGVMCFMRPCIF